MEIDLQNYLLHILNGSTRAKLIGELPNLAKGLRWRRKIGQAAKVGSTSLKDGLYDWETEAVLG